MCNNNNILILDSFKLTFLKLTLHTNNSYSCENNSHIDNQLYVKHIPSYKFYPYVNTLSMRNLCFLVDCTLSESINLKSW